MTNEEKKSFREFIIDARQEAREAEEGSLQEEQEKNLIRGFYDVVSTPHFTLAKVEGYLAEKGYALKDRDKDFIKIKNLHYSTKYFWEFDDEDY